MAYLIYAGDGGVFKLCGRCQTVKALSMFHKRRRGGFSPIASCKECQQDILRNRDRKETDRCYRQKSKSQRNLQQAKWRAANPDYRREWYSKHSERIIEAQAKRRAADPEPFRQRARRHAEKLRKTPKGRVDESISASIRNSIVRGSKAGRKWEGLVGYSVDDLIAHLERQFQPGMTWENYGRGGWHIDHEIPKVAFNYETPDHIDFRKCWALSNLRPLWELENLKKHSKLDRPFQPSLAI